MNRVLIVSRAGKIFDESALQKFFADVFLLMAAGLTVTGLIAGWISHDSAAMTSLFRVTHAVTSAGTTVREYGASFWWYAAVAGELGMVFAISRSKAIRESGRITGLTLFMIFAALNGITLAPVIYAYTDVSVTRTFLITAIVFLSAAIAGHTTKINLLKMSSFLLMALVGMIAALVVNMFLQSTMMDYVISIFGVLLFIALTAFDMQNLRAYYGKAGATEGLVVFGALTLYLDFINLFLYLLRFLGERR